MAHRIKGVKNGFLILLHILIVGQRQALQHGESAHQIAVYPACLAPHQLCHIRVFLLRHNGGAGGIGVRQFYKVELPAAPEDDLLGKAGQVHHNGGQSRQQLYAEIPVGYCVNAVAARAVKPQKLGGHLPAGGIGRACQRTGAQRGLVHPLCRVLQTGHIPAEHHGIGQQMMGEQNRLRPLEVGITGNNGVAVGLRLICDYTHQRFQLLHKACTALPQIQPQIHRHLIVAASGCMETLARISDPLRQHLLHKHMDILCRRVNGKASGFQIIQNSFQSLNDLLHLSGIQNSLCRQHFGMGNRAGDVLLGHPLIHCNGGVEVVRRLIQLFLSPSGPHLFHHASPFLSCFRRNGFKIYLPAAHKVERTAQMPQETPERGDDSPFRTFLQLSLLPQRLHLGGQTPEVDEAGGLCLIVIALAEGHQILRVQGIRRSGAGGDDVALVEL